MANPGQYSFRRILLFRILLLSIPVLIAGEFVAYQKAKDSLLETARQNLTESAVRKGETIRDLVEAMRANLVTASETLSNQINKPESAQDFVNRMARWLPTGVRCVQLTNTQTSRIEATTCQKTPIAPVLGDWWTNPSSVLLDRRASVHIEPIVPSASRPAPSPDTGSLRQLDLVFSAPIFDSRGELRYVLSVQAALHRQETSQPGSLSGSTVVLDQEGTILVHPQASQIGRNVRDEPNAERLHDILRSAIAGKQDFSRLASFENQGTEWFAGYSPVQIQITPTEERTWVVLAVTPLNNALYGLEGIQQVLIILTVGLVTANVLATLYLARELARPIEKLSDYARHIYQRSRPEQAPKNFKIAELNQLSVALDSMVKRLEERAEELETAWQEAHVANQLKSEFLATTSHELRTPLNAIIGCVRLVRDDCCDSKEEELEFLQQADEAAIHLLKIINDLLDIAKIEAGKVELNLQPVSIQDLCQQCLRMVQPGAEKKHLDLDLEVDRHLSRVPIDERRVRQMIINLLSNAVKFTPEQGQVRLIARMGYGHQLAQDIRPDHSPINDDTPYLCLEVQDSGIGIPPERWHLLFRPFQQIDSSLTRKHEGTGLGLALTKRLAELHGGTISFQSTPGKGSTFRIWLPSREAPSIATEPSLALQDSSAS